MSLRSLPSGADLERFLEAIEISQYEDFYQALPRDVRERLGIGLHREGSTLRLTAAGYDHPMLNRVMGVGLNQEIAAYGPESVLDRAAVHYEAAGVRRWMLQLLPHVEPEGFEEAAGRRRGHPPPRMGQHLRATDREITSRSELRIVDLGHGNTGGDENVAGLADAWAEILVRNFEFPPPFRNWLRTLHGRERWRLFLALDGDTPVATGALFLSESDAGLIGQLTFGSTLPEYRDQGAQSGLIARRIEDARNAGARWVVSETDEELSERPNPSTRNLVRLGLPVTYVRANWGPPKPDG